MTGKAEEEELKSSLVRTRKIIADKFRELHHERLERDGKMEKKYNAMSESLKKKIHQQQGRNSKKV